jgi:WhiB family transcriptional regulator, redox-sensing transcriptional regulator
MISLFVLPVTGAEPCAQSDPEMFFEESGPQALLNLPILRKLCADCPILTECREHAVRHELYGFWGGLTMKERKKERKRRGITLDSPSVINQRIYSARVREQRERERDALSLLSAGGTVEHEVAGAGEDRSSAA